jgi:putative DNA primase/helicase
MSSAQTFGTVAAQLAANGYEPVPIIPGEKRPVPDHWQAGGWESKIDQYYNSYTGILTRHTPGIDIDVSDPSLVAQIRNIVLDVTDCFEMPPPRRIGNAPRELLLFKTEEEFAKLSTAAYVLPTDKPDSTGKTKGSKVEILASGQQFVAYAVHPTTQKPYTWNGCGEPLEINRAKLVTLDEYQAKEIVRRCEALLAHHGQRVESKPLQSGTIAERIPNERLKANDPLLATQALTSMENPNLPFDDWLRILYATKSALGDEGHDAFMYWSAKSSKHDPAFAEKEWRKAKPTRIGAGSLIWSAHQLGWTPPQPINPFAADDDGVIQDGVLNWPDKPRGKSTKPPATLENFAYLSKILGVKYAMDIMRGQEVVTIPTMAVAEGSEGNSAVTHMQSAAIRAEMPHALVPEYMAMLCAQNPFHPAQQWIESHPWDGIGRIQQWLDTITASNTKLKESMMRKWAISAIAAIYKQGGVSAHGVLTFLGAQGLGKTSWFLSLTPKETGLSKDGMILRPESPDSVRQVTGHWMVELGELDATFRKSDIAALKAFITQSSDTYRLPYARKNTINPRRTVFFASVNDERFLSDNTGNRRYWTIDCKAINYEHGIDMQQFWAEVKTLYDAGETWFLDASESVSLNESNEQYMTIDPIVERLHDRLDWDADKSRWVRMTATQIAIEVGILNPGRSEATRVGTYLGSTMGATRKVVRGVQYLVVPPKKPMGW